MHAGARGGRGGGLAKIELLEQYSRVTNAFHYVSKAIMMIHAKTKKPIKWNTMTSLRGDGERAR